MLLTSSRFLMKKLIPLLALFVAACSPERGPEDLVGETEELVVLDAILIVDAPFSTITLTRTVSPLADFTLEAIAERAAGIRVESEHGDVISYTEDPQAPGRYMPFNQPTPLVQPETRYDITVNTTDGQTITGTTTTPARFDIDRWILLDDDAESELLEFMRFEDIGDAVYTEAGSLSAR